MFRRWLSRAAACSAATVAVGTVAIGTVAVGTVVVGAVVLGTVAVAPAALAAPAVAGGAAGSIVIDSVSSPPTESGLLSIQAEATSPITSISASIGSGAIVDYPVPASDLTLTSGSAQDGIWTVKSPITQSELPIGTYQVTVTATDSGGDTVTSAPQSFFFGLDPSVTLSASTSTLSYSQQSVAFSGQATAYYPDGTVQPVPAGQVITIEGQDGDSYTATTDAAGNFSVIASPAVYNKTSLSESYTANIAASATTQPASSTAVSLSAQVEPVQITVALSTSVAKFGTAVTLTGTALYQSGGIWIPLGNSPVDVTGSDFYSSASVGPITATTNGSGVFSVVLPAQPTTTWTANPAPSPYLSTTSQPGSALPNSAVLTVSLPTKVPALSLTYKPTGRLTASGCLDLAAAVTSFPDLTPPPGTPLSLQSAGSRSGPWHTLGALGAGRQACRHGTGFRTVYGSAPVSAYFRVSYGGQLFYQPAVSAVVHAATAPTRFAGFNIRPRSVSRNGRITVSGELERKTAHGWQGLADAKITILIDPAPGSAWYWFKRVDVSRSGRFRVSFADPISAHWYVAYAGDATHLLTQSTVIYVQAGRG